MEFSIDDIQHAFLEVIDGRGSLVKPESKIFLWSSYLVNISMCSDFEDSIIGITVDHWRDVICDYLPAIEQASLCMGADFKATADGLIVINSTKFVFLQGYRREVLSSFKLMRAGDLGIA